MKFLTIERFELWKFESTIAYELMILAEEKKEVWNKLQVCEFPFFSCDVGRCTGKPFFSLLEGYQRLLYKSRRNPAKVK